MSRGRIVSLAVVGALAAAGCRRAPAAPPNVLLITLDTVRADHIGCYGASNAFTPALDALAASGVRFDHAYAPVPLTLPSHVTMMTGLEPPAHGVVDNDMALARLPAPTLAERLAARGYDTGAFVSAFVLNRLFGLDRGFAVYDDGRAEQSDVLGSLHSHAPGEERVEAVLAWLRHPRDRPFFAWLHLFDAHAPHVAPAPFAKRFASRPYAGEIAYLDHQVGRLLAYLDSQKLRERTLVVVVADHGEGLGEHGEETHGVLLYDATLRVPFIVSGPGARVPAGTVRSDPATLADLAPTVIDLLGLPPNDVRQGRALLAAAPPTPRPLWAQSDYPHRQLGWARLRALRDGRFKVIAGPRPELYDVASDPSEQQDVAAREPGTVARLERVLHATETALSAPATGGGSPLDAEVLERLEALGYAAGGASAATPAPGALVNPRDEIGRLDALGHAWAALSTNDLRTAERLFRAAERDAIQPKRAIEGLGKTLDMMGRDREAEAAYRRVLAFDPKALVPLSRLVVLARRSGDVAREVAAARALSEAFPRPPGLRLLAEALDRSGDAKGAEATYRRCLEIAPGDTASRKAWAGFLIAHGRRSEATREVAALRGSEPGDPEVDALTAALRRLPMQP